MLYEINKEATSNKNEKDLTEGLLKNEKDSVEAFLNKPENQHILIIYRLLKYSALEEKFSIIFSFLNQKFREKRGFMKHFLKRFCANFKKIREGFTYDITPKFIDEGLFYFESVKRKHILHTNLSLAYEFSSTLLHSKRWNTLLLISERGKFIANHFEGKLANKQVIIIACHEAVAEYLNKPISTTTDALSEAYKEKHELKNANVEILFLPYWRHHHHTAIFLNVVEKKHLDKRRASFEIKGSTYSCEVRKSIYYFKQGFSNKINPILVPCESDKEVKPNDPIQNDQALLLDTFIAHYIKASVYQKDNRIIPVISKDLTFDIKIKGDTKSTKFSKDKFLKKLKDNLEK